MLISSMLWNVIAGAIFLYFAFSVIYLFVFALTGIFFYKTKYVKTAPKCRFAVFVPAYKEDQIIVSTAKSMLSLNYPQELYDVYIIADSFQPETLNALSQLPVEVIEVSFEKSTKAKALNVGFERMTKNYDIALICDADNVLAPNFLRIVNDAFVSGAKAVQGRRVAKNFDTNYAILDACSEAINNHIFRKGFDAMGLSSSLIGSGMAFDFATAKAIIAEINAVGGFDRPLQIKNVERGTRIEYLEDAVVFDEKVDSLSGFKQQRKRWLSSQIVYLREYFVPGVRALFQGNMSYFNLAVLNSLVLPRAFLLLLLPLVSIIAFIANTSWGYAFAALFTTFIITLLISIPKRLFNKDLLKALIKLPGATLAMFSTLIGIKDSNKTFIHTNHTKTEVTNPMYEEHRY